MPSSPDRPPSGAGPPGSAPTGSANTGATLADAAADLLLGSRCVGCHRPGRLLCPGCRAGLPDAAAPSWPTPTPAGLVTPWAAGEHAGVLRDLVVAHKERGVRGVRPVLCRLLALAVLAAAPPDHPPVPLVLVPVPSRPGSARRRGDDPTPALVHGAARLLRAGGHDVRAVGLLAHRGGVVDQSGLDHHARAANLAGALCAPSDRLRRLALRVPQARVLVCDDVLTTGATAHEAQRALAASGVEVHAVAVVAATRRRLRGAGLTRSPDTG